MSVNLGRSRGWDDADNLGATLSLEASVAQWIEQRVPLPRNKPKPASIEGNTVSRFPLLTPP